MKKYHCFFEQSGTFKNEFKKLGYEAFDYDILNDFNETDYVIDLYDEIEKSYLGLNSIFDKMQKEEDTIIAFFPCVRFEAQVLLNFRGENNGFCIINYKHFGSIGTFCRLLRHGDYNFYYITLINKNASFFIT